MQCVYERANSNAGPQLRSIHEGGRRRQGYVGGGRVQW